MNDWTEPNGRKHRGLIDGSHELYSGYKSIYPNAIDKLKLISPRKYRTQMVDEFIELMDLGVIKFPYEFKQEFISIAKKKKTLNKKLLKNINYPKKKLSL